MKDEVIYSKTLDKGIKKDIKNSPIWKDAHTKEELSDTNGYYKYSIRFDGLKPVQVLKIQKVNK
jgi:hypothetical protein